MQKFRSKPAVIEAVEATGTPESNRQIIEWARGGESFAHMGDADGDHQTLYIETLEGAMRVTPGDWIIKGTRGEFYPCKPDVFAVKYEPAE
jgi:hypothetical protein